MIETTGGFSPPERHRRRCALTPAEREEISRGLATGESLRAIARRLGRSASTVCREVNRNGGRNKYPATRGDEEGGGRNRRPQRDKISGKKHPRDLVGEKNEEEWVPQQISGRRKRGEP